MRKTVHILVLLLASTSIAQDPSSARTFVEHLYLGYEHPLSARDPDTLWKLAPSIFSPGMLNLIRHAQRVNNGYSLDADPVCDCQDFEELKLRDLTVDPVNGARTTASVVVQLFANDPSSTRSLRLSLVYTAKGWRIDDISTTEIPSIRKLLQSDH